MKLVCTLALVVILGAADSVVIAQDQTAPGGADAWLPTLLTDTPQEGFELAVTLARKGVSTTQPNVEVLKELRPAYANDAQSLIAVSQVVAVHFQTIAAANGYWRSAEEE